MLLAFAVTIPSIGSGLLLDDHTLVQVVQAVKSNDALHFWNLFDVCGRSGPGDIALRIALGALPWWSLPNLTMALFRPVAAATHFVDFSLWSEHPALMHLQNSAWYVLLVWLVARLYRRFDGPSWSAVCGLLFFAVSEAHAEGTAWISGRNTLMAAVAAAAVLLLHDRDRRDGSRSARWLAPLCLLFGLGSSEGAIAIWAFLGSYALFIDEGRPRARLLGLAPLLAVTAGWQLAYRAAGYGVHGSAAYRDPGDVPLIFLTQQVPKIAPFALRDLLLPSGTRANALPAPVQSILLLSMGLLAAGSVVLLLGVARRRRQVAFWLAALLFAVLPLCTVDLARRLFFIPSIAASALAGHLVVTLAAFARSSAPAAIRAGAAALAGLFFVLHGPAALWLAPRAYLTLVNMEIIFRESAKRTPPHAATTVDTAFVVNTPNYFITRLSSLYDKTGAWPPRMYILGSTAAPVHLSRPDSSSLILETDGGYLDDAYSRLVRAPEYGFARGDTIAMGPLLVTVEETTIDRRPRRVRFRSPAPELGELRALWLIWHEDRYQQIELPAVGAVRELPGS
jgi:hypothetical protein